MNTTLIPSPHVETIRRLYKGGAVLRPQLEDFDIDLLHAAVGISTEAGELLEAILPLHITDAYDAGGARRSTDPWEHAVDVENVVEELGDHLFYEGALRISALLESLGGPDGAFTSLGLWPESIGGPLARANDPAVGRKRILVQLIMLHAALAGKILDVVKRKVMYRKPFDSAPEGEVSLKDRLRQHLVDDAWVIEQLAALIGRSEEDLREANIVKLEKGKAGKKARYADGYSDAAAVARADKDGEEKEAGALPQEAVDALASGDRASETIGVTFGNPAAVAKVIFVADSEETQPKGDA